FPYTSLFRSFSGCSDAVLLLPSACFADALISASGDLHDTPNVLDNIQVHQRLYRGEPMIRRTIVISDSLQLIKTEFQLAPQFAAELGHRLPVVLLAFTAIYVVNVGHITNRAVGTWRCQQIVIRFAVISGFAEDLVRHPVQQLLVLTDDRLQYVAQMVTVTIIGVKPRIEHCERAYQLSFKISTYVLNIFHVKSLRKQKARVFF